MGPAIALFDRNGHEITPGCRVRYCLPDHYVNTKAGTGTVVSLDEYGGAYYDADTPEPVRDRNGAYSEKRARQYANFSHYDQAAKRRIAIGKLGDPFEHGQTDVFMEVID
jgi:hypothetical protein